MVRPTKQGVDYFPLDVHLDNKFKFIEIKYGLEGFAIVIKILQEIYSNGYYCDWDEDEILLFSSEHNASYELVKGVTNESLEREIFCNSLFSEYRILTSSGIQKRYKEIVRRRKNVEINDNYLLIDGNWGVNDDMVTTSSKHHVVKSTQSKVKESKGKESKEVIPYAEIVDYLNEKANKRFSNKTTKTRDLIRARWNEGHKLDDFKHVIDICVSEWSGKTFANGKKGDDYLQPSTLFNGKFDERLNWTRNKPNQVDDIKRVDATDYIDSLGGI